MNTTIKGTSRSASESRRALLAERLRQASESMGPAPLSFGQQRLWFLQQLEPESALYNVPVLARLSGELNQAALERSLEAVVQRHEVLRTKFKLLDEEPVQMVCEPGSLQLQWVDLLNLPAGERNAEMQRLTREEINRPFNLSEEMPFRVLLLRVEPDEYLLVLTIHHIVFDEWSLSIFFRELGSFYEGFMEGHPSALPPLPIQYADFAIWQRDWMRGPMLKQQLSYWKGRLSDRPPLLDLPADRPRRPIPTFCGAQRTRELGLALKAGLRHAAESVGATPFMVSLAAFMALLQRYTDQDDIVVGCPIAGRNRIETQQLIGFFVNTLPLRVGLGEDPSFEQLLGRVREATLGAYANQDVPFDKIVEELQPERSLTHLPFSRTMFVLQSEPLEAMQLGPVKVQFIDAATDTAKFDLTLVLQNANRGLIVRAEYNSDLFDAPTIDRLLEHFGILLQGSLEHPERRLSQLPLLGEAERHLMIQKWNRTEREYPQDRSIHELFEAQAAKTPESAALVFEQQALTYGELNERANQLAHYLRKVGVSLESPVAVCLERSSNMILAWLAILKAGGAYVPLDTSYPTERLAFMLRDTAAPVLLTQQSLLGHVPRDLAKAICLDSDWELIAHEDRRNPAPVSGPENLAYIIYTSGSTGEPKGVAVPHGAVNRLVLNTNYIEFGPDDRVAQVSNASFDAATFEVWGALLNGGKLVGIPQDVALAPSLFARRLREEKITAMFLTSALFNQLAREAPGAFETVRTLIAGGEALDPKWVRAVLEDRPPARLLNGYGPTENTTFTCCHFIRELAADATQVPIGRPIANTQVYILDRHLNPVPIGVAGELYAGGAGLARGYWNRPELTASRFVRNPFDIAGQSQLYRTGDRARYLPDGTIEFLGRFDQQVKIRGFRIELGEIEAVLSRHPGVRQCVAHVHGTTTENRRLIAYILPNQAAAPNSSDLRAYLTEHLPDYMIPAAFVSLGELPLTPNGKVDRQSLPVPDQARPALDRQYAPPRDEVELRLARIWESVLRVQPVGVHDNFFDLGGHSLLAVRLAAQIQKAFGKQLRLATIFQAPTIAQLAPILREEVKESALGSASSIIELQPQGSRPPLFLVHGAGGGMFWGYANLSRLLGPDQPVFGFNSRGLDGREELDRIEDLAKQYVRDLRSRQPAGPYYLGGYCFGGNVAYEMARQLSEQGEEVALLALFNCAPPNSSYTRIPWTPLWFLRLARNLLYWANYCRQWSPSQRREFFRWKWELLKKRFARFSARPEVDLGQVDAGDLVDLSAYTPEQRRVWEAHLRALFRYHPQGYQGCAHLFRSPGHQLWCSFDPDYGWGPLARGGVQITILPGAHEKILEEPCVAVLARAVQEALSDAAARSSPAQAKPEELQKSLDYWKRRLAGAPPLLDLPGDFVRPQELPAPQGSRTFRVPEALADAVEKFSFHSNGSVTTTLLSAFTALLYRYTGQTDLVIGGVLPKSQTGRSSSAPVASLPLRCELSDELGFRSLSGRLGAVIAEAQKAGIVPFEKMVTALQLESNRSYAPIFQVLYSSQDKQGLERNGSGSGAAADFGHAANLDLEFQIERNQHGLCGRIRYNTALFTDERMARMADHFLILLAEGIKTPDMSIARLPLLPQKEVKLLSAWNQTAAQYPRAKTVIDLIGEQVARAPSAEALIFGEVHVTYGELYQRAQQLGDRLRALGVGPGQLVGICLDRSPEMVASLLGVWLAGGAYVPLDPAYPRERLAFMAQDAQLRVILTQRKLKESLPATSAQVLLIDELIKEPASGSATVAAPLGLRANDLAYVIYTSGSTGKPKGVALEHQGVVAFICWARQFFTDEELAGVLASTSICFDLSVFELFVPLCWGGKVILVQNALALPGLSVASPVTLINTVPSAIRELVRLRAVPDSVRVINLAGEPLPADLVDQLYQNTHVSKVHDLYGPTETTVYSTVALRRAGAPATIGRPLSNEQIWLLDQHHQLAPIGVPGELYIGGDGLARGYLNRPELTSQRFVPHPFEAGARLYKTGDLARWREDGNLEFLGRIDHQVKIRGFRIELGEIEAVLKKHSAVRDLVLIAREDVPGDKRLIAYVTVQPGASAAAADLRLLARQALPEFMVPSAFVFLDQLPLTPNGKLDRKALPLPAAQRPSSARPLDLPRSALDEKMVRLWQEVLGVEHVGVEDSFFELGGHSLLATRLVSRIRETFEVEMPLETVFAASNLRALCAQLTKSSGSAKVASPPALLPGSHEGSAPLAFVQERLWFLDQLNPGSHAYNVPIALRLEGALNLAALQRAIDRVVSRHESLRATFRYESDRLVQDIAPVQTIEVRLQEFNPATTADVVVKARQWITREAQQPFDLSRGPLLRVALARLSAAEHILLVAMHHIVSDGWSLAVFFEELEIFYRAFAAGEAAPALPALPVRYIDFAHWQRQAMQGDYLLQGLRYWREKLAGAPPRIELPVDRAEPAQPTGHAARIAVRLSERLAQALFEPSRREGCTPFMILLAGLAIVLTKWTGQKDLVIGTVMAGRSRSELEKLIGCFMNFVPLRTTFDKLELGHDLLGRTRSTVLEAQTHQDCPFEKIVEAINPERRLNQNPLYNVALLFQNFPPELFSDENLHATPVQVSLEAALLDLRFEVERARESELIRSEVAASSNGAQVASGQQASEPGRVNGSAHPHGVIGHPAVVAKAAGPSPNGKSGSRTANLDDYVVTCDYRTELFDETTIQELLVSYVEVLEQLLQQPETRLTEIHIRPSLMQQAETARTRQRAGKFAVAATFTAEPIADPLRYWFKELELTAAIEFAPYNQVFQELLDPASLLGTNSSGLNVLLIRLEDWLSDRRGLSQDLAALEEVLRRNATEFVQALKAAAARANVPYLVCLCPPSEPLAGAADCAKSLGATEGWLAAELEPVTGVYVLTSAQITQWYPVPDYYDAGAEELGHVPYTPRLFTALATAIVRKFHGLQRSPHKVIVLDCDQTLWAGVCGEDGPNGVRLDLPYLGLQQFMRAQHEAGRLLCLCSKNNETDPLEVFARRLEMPLRREHFASWRLNWQPKSENLKALAAELGLGLESFIFVDDNPLECAEVEANCPEVLALQLPADPARIPQFLQHCWVFDHLKLTAEDRRRTDLYRQNVHRERLRQASPSLAQFLAGLELEVRIGPIKDAQVARVAQLTQRTNQFNLTTQRLTEPEVQLLRLRSELLVVEVSDRFGDYGLVGVIIGAARKETLEVDSFLLSCRVLGRGVEHQMLARLGRLAQERGARWLDLHFVRSERNKPALDFLDSVGAHFKQPLNGGYVYRFPAAVAAEVVFCAAKQTDAATPTSSSAADIPKRGADALRKPVPYGAIALATGDWAWLQAKIEAGTVVHRTGVRANYVAPKTALQRQLCDLWQKLLKVERVGLADNFFELGGHSLLAVRLFAEIEHLIGRRFPLITLFQAPTIGQLAGALTQEAGAPLHPLLVPVQPRGAKPPLFLIHGAGGDVLWGYANLAAHLPPDQPIYGIKSRGQAGLEDSTRVAEMARDYLQAVRALQPEGPYYLGGYCFGGNVAYEMARQLHEAGQEAALVALIDTAPANAGYERVTWWEPTFAWRFSRNLGLWLKDFAGLRPEERRSFIARKSRALGRKLKRKLRLTRDTAPVDLEEVIETSHFPSAELKLWQTHLQALVEHVEQPYPGQILLLRTGGQPLFCSLAEDFCWGKLARGGVVLRRIPGSHENIFVEPHVQELARTLADALDSAHARTPQPAIPTPNLS